MWRSHLQYAQCADCFCTFSSLSQSFFRCGFHTGEQYKMWTYQGDICSLFCFLTTEPSQEVENAICLGIELTHSSVAPLSGCLHPRMFCYYSLVMQIVYSPNAWRSLTEWGGRGGDGHLSLDSSGKSEDIGCVANIRVVFKSGWTLFSSVDQSQRYITSG